LKFYFFGLILVKTGLRKNAGRQRQPAPGAAAGVFDRRRAADHLPEHCRGPGGEIGQDPGQRGQGAAFSGAGDDHDGDDVHWYVIYQLFC